MLSTILIATEASETSRGLIECLDGLRRVGAGTVTATVEIFEPPMCCPTGLCGPVQDQTLLDLLETVRALESSGVRVARYQPNTNPAAFTNHAEVMAAVRARSTAALPITLVNGRVVKSGAYASLEEIQGALNAGAR